MDRKDTVIISVSVDRKLNEEIEKVSNNKSKLTEWLFIKYLERNGVDVIEKMKF